MGARPAASQEGKMYQPMESVDVVLRNDPQVAVCWQDS